MLILSENARQNADSSDADLNYKTVIDSWMYAAHIEEGLIFRQVNKGDNVMGGYYLRKLFTASLKSMRKNWKRTVLRRMTSEEPLPN